MLQELNSALDGPPDGGDHRSGLAPGQHEQNQKFRLPDDGLLGRPASGVIAERVCCGWAAYQCGIREGDVLLAIQTATISRANDVPKLLRNRRLGKCRLPPGTRRVDMPGNRFHS